MLDPDSFFDLHNAETAQLFAGCEHVWDAVSQISRHIDRLVGNTRTIHGEIMDGAYLSDRPLHIAAGARIEPGAYVQGPAYIGPGAVVRHGAYVRDNVILMEGSTLGHASEAKNSLFLPHAAAPHFNYVGDSVLGHYVNLGAGTKLSNLGILSEKDARSGKRPSIQIRVDERHYDTGIAKLGAILGDFTQTGCNAVLNPGCLIGPHTLVYANASVRKGYHAAHSIVKLRQNVRRVERRPRS